MPIFKDDKPKEQAPVACFSNHVISERIMLYRDNVNPPVELGIKKFHCVRRFMYNKIPGKCETCNRDMSRECFYIHKQYFSPEMLMLITRLYEDCVKTRFSGSIWPEDSCFNAVLKAMERPMPINQIKETKKDYYQILEEKQDSQVPF